MINFVVVLSDLRPCVLNTWVKRGAEVSTAHHLMMNWIRWRGRVPDRPGRPRHVVRAKNFSCIQGEAGNIKSDDQNYSSVEVAARSYGWKVIGVSRCGNQRICWWTPAVKEVVGLQKVVFSGFVGPGVAETAPGQKDCCYSGRQTKK